MKKMKVCPKCKNSYPDIANIQYCICGHKFNASFDMDHLRQVSKDTFGEDLFSGLNTRKD